MAVHDPLYDMNLKAAGICVLKDIEVIRDFLSSFNLNSPTFEAAAKIYDQAKDTIPKHYDTAAVYEQLKINNNS